MGEITHAQAGGLLLGETVQHNFRIPKRLGDEAFKKAEKEGLDRPDLIKLLLLAYVAGDVKVKA